MLQGTPYIYQGEEIGMTNVAFDSIQDYRDVETHNMYREFVQDKGMDAQVVLGMIHSRSRDNARTPVQWDSSQNAGFTSGQPWIKVNPNYPQINVRQALDDPDSIFTYYQKLIRLRKEYPVVVYGSYDLILEDHPQIYAFTRALDGERLLVVLNFSREEPVCELPAGIHDSEAELLIGNYAAQPEDDIRRLTLRPYEARVYQLKGK
jgi:oligo-1,6-glucosidase